MSKANTCKKLLNKTKTSFIIIIRNPNKKVVIILPIDDGIYIKKVNTIIKKINK